MLKHIATWALSTKIVGIWSQQLPVMKGIQLTIYLFDKFSSILHICACLYVQVADCLSKLRDSKK